MKDYIRTEQQRLDLIEKIKAQKLGEYGFLNIIETGKRTLKQNRAMHQYFENLSVVLNDAGLDQRKLLKETIDIPWNKDSVKEHLWKPIQKVVMGSESTTKLNRAEVSDVYDVLQRHLAERHGILVEFPSYEKPL